MSSYIQYLTLIHPDFIEQIGTGKFMIPHSDDQEYYWMQLGYNRARRALPFVVLMIIVLCVMAWMDLH